MKLLEKTVELGEMTFKVVTNRDIAVKSFEEYPEVLKYIFKNQNGKQKDWISLIENKGLSELFKINDEIAKLVEFALPLMLEAAKDKTKAKKVIDYARDNDVIEEFNAGILEFLAQGFTQGELAKKPKVKFSMK